MAKQNIIKASKTAKQAGVEHAKMLVEKDRKDRAEKASKEILEVLTKYNCGMVAVALGQPIERLLAVQVNIEILAK